MKRFATILKRQADILYSGDEMHIAPTCEPTEAPTRQASSPWKDYLIFTLCASLYLLPFMRVIFVVTDEGTLLDGAVRVVRGQVFARDFFEAMGPGTFYWLAAFFKVFGVTFLASRICLFVSSLGTALSIYFLSRRICTRYKTLPCLILAGTCFGGIWPGISHHVDSTFFALLSVVCLIIWQDKRKSGLLVAAGILAGVTASTLQPKGMLLLCAMLVWLCLQHKTTLRLRLSLGMLTGGFLSVVGIVLAYFWSQGALRSLVYANYTFPSQHYAAVNTVSYASGLFSYYWRAWATGTGATWMVGIAAILITPFLLVAALPAFILLAGLRSDWKSMPSEITLYWICGGALWLSEYHRPDIWHLVFGSPLLIVLCIYALSESRRKLANVAVQLLAISAVFLASVNFCIVLAMGAHRSVTRVGNVAVVGRNSDQLLKFLNDHVLPGEEILIYPYCPTYYFLSATTNPTRYSFLQFNYNTPSQFQEVEDILDQKKVRYVVWDTTFADRLAENFPELLLKPNYDLILGPYLESHYKLVEDDNGIKIMERKSTVEIQAISSARQ